MRSASKTIARIIARLNVGGPSIQAILMTDAFRRRGYRALLLTGEVAEGESSMEYLAEANNVKPIKLNSMSRRVSLHKDLITLMKLTVILWREKPFIIHTHTAKAGTLGRLAAIVAGVPIRVHTFHGHVFEGYFSRLTTQLCLLIERVLARTTDRIIAISESQRKELVDLYRIASAEKIVTIPLGFDLSPFLNANSTGSFRNSIKCDADRLLVGWVGRLSPIKSPELFLDSAALIRDSGMDASFVLVGDGELRASCEDQVHCQKLADVVKMTGWRRDLSRVYPDLDLVVNSSINEGTPVSLLEAMACARSFIATDVGGVIDLMVGCGERINRMTVFRNGILIPRDPPTLACAIRYLSERPSLRKEMGLAGREFVRQRFCDSRLANDLEELYLSLGREKGYLSQSSSSSDSSSPAASVEKSDDLIHQF